MKKLYYRIRYYWHFVRLKELAMLIPDCLDACYKERLELKKKYHEEAILHLEQLFVIPYKCH
ncbi:hypothetical protein ACFFF5_14290 [Lederbergia wuyishanensis]|uniref:Uncharacterized protein n=1 Tax=Lederbergia wuyishanensis TaxID=1347903 RepID=A0ABU0D9L0_9BACI|nr:hypothetical protein [Lederbergia wuyishanensis]MCJ8007465.1 hypothetical protein [Lederbergia wuyishanensis]MDQ0345096.1 hypothetical protein [Lederbergia wuyishanensis]